MAGQTLKSTSITNLDASPIKRATAGQAGGQGQLVFMADYVSPGATDDNTSIYKLIRVPSNASIQRLAYETMGTITTLTGDFTIYYSDASGDFTGSSQGDTGLVNSLSGSSALFAHAQACATTKAVTDITNLAGNYDITKRIEPLWQAAGLSSDPGGFFDIVFLPTSTNSLTAGATLAVMAEMVVPYR